MNPPSPRAIIRPTHHPASLGAHDPGNLLKKKKKTKHSAPKSKRSYGESKKNQGKKRKKKKKKKEEDREVRQRVERRDRD